MNSQLERLLAYINDTIDSRGQSGLNDVERIYASTRAKNIPLTRVDVSADDLVSGQVLKRFPTGVFFRCHAESPELAAKIISLL